MKDLSHFTKKIGLGAQERYTFNAIRKTGDRRFGCRTYYEIDTSSLNFIAAHNSTEIYRFL